MEDRRWEDMHTDMLVKIFKFVDILDLTPGIACVCRSWREAFNDPLLWKTLDLSLMRSDFMDIPFSPYVQVLGESDERLTRSLKIALSLSRENITTLIFHFELYVSNYQLTYTAERCPHLRRLVMPAWNTINDWAICEAIRIWPYLESLTMPPIAEPSYLMEEIANNCKKFSELKVIGSFQSQKIKVMGAFGSSFAAAIIRYLPKIRVLSLRCLMLVKDDLISILDNLQNLEVLNISHCLLIEKPPHAPRIIMMELDQSILGKASRLRKFMRCTDLSCTMCQRTRNDEGIMRWDEYEEGLWKADEVSSLSL